MQRKLAIALAVLGCIVVLFVFPRVHVVRGSISGGTIFWKSDEALIFIEASESGIRTSYVRLALDPILAGVGIVRRPNEERCSQVLVLRVTDKDVERFDTDLYRYAEEPYCGMHTALSNGHIYMGYLAQDKNWKWSGRHFETTTSDELRVVNLPRAASRGLQFDNVDGWSMRTFGQGAPKYDLVLNGQSLSISFNGEAWPSKPLSVDLVRAGQNTQRIWELDGRPRRVSKAEYERVFGNY